MSAKKNNSAHSGDYFAQIIKRLRAQVFHLIVPIFLVVCSFSVNSVERDKSFYFPGEALSKDEIRVTLMGTYAAIRRAQANCSVFVELGNGDAFVFDLGAGSTANYNALGVSFSRMDKIFLSHLHIDHYSDLTYVYGMGPFYGRTSPLNVWGPSSKVPELGISYSMEALKNSTNWSRKSFRIVSIGKGHELNVHEVNPRKTTIVYDENDVLIKAFPAVHIMEGAVSYRLEWKGMTIVYSGDTAPNKFMVENARGVDLLIHEVNDSPKVWEEKLGIPVKEGAKIIMGTHTSPRAWGKVLSLTQPRMGVMIHVAVNADTRIPLVDEVRVHYDGEIRIGEDMMVFNITKDKVTQRMGVGPDRAWWKTEHRDKAGEPPETIDTLMEQWLKDALITEY